MVLLHYNFITKSIKAYANNPFDFLTRTVRSTNNISTQVTRQTPSITMSVTSSGMRNMHIQQCNCRRIESALTGPVGSFALDVCNYIAFGETHYRQLLG